MNAQLDALKSILIPLLQNGLAVAFSGGLDSRFLLHIATDTAREHCLPLPVALHVSGPHVPQAETARAEKWIQDKGVALHVLSINPLELPEVALNTRERCYFCKRVLFIALREKATALGLGTLADGTNVSDRGLYRPGLRALEELGIASPLTEAGLTKPDVHALAARTGLSQPDQRPRPCLLTRLPYDTPITEARLREIEELETQVEAFFITHGLSGGADSPDYRLRWTADGPHLHLEPGLTNEQLAALQSSLLNVPLALVEKVSGLYDVKGKQ